MEYTQRERFWFMVIAVVGFAGVNGTFLWAVLAHPNILMSALKNPIAAAFIGEAFLLVGVLAYLLTRWKVSKIHWAWFVLLSIIGSILFALPVVLLLSANGQRSISHSVDPPDAAGDSSKD